MKKIELTKEEAFLYNELKKLAKRANQRILRLERYTKIDQPFAVKQLFDYLSVSEINGLTKSGTRVKASKSMTLSQMKDTIKAINIFLNDIEGSTVSGIKQIKSKIEKQFEAKDIDIESINAYYQSFDSYTWIYEFMPASEFWNDYGNPARFGWIGKGSFVESLSFVIQKSDEIYKQALENLYDYCKGV